MEKIFSFCTLFFLLSVMGVDGQTITRTVRTEIAQTMLRNGDIDNSCVRQQGGLGTSVSIDAKFLNKDTQPEYIVSGSGSCCIGARRCNTWIYKKTSGGYAKIFGGREGLQGDVSVAKTRTKGYLDILTAEYSGPDVFPAIFKFNGIQYKHWKNLKPLRPGF